MIETERHLTLSEAARISPGRPHVNSIWRACRKGIKARNGERVKLEHIRFGGRIYTSAEALARFAKRVADAGGDYVDAPVSGGTLGAEAGTLTIMAGGSTEALARAGALFDVLGTKTTHVGDVGAGQLAKLTNQIIVGLVIGAVAEGLLLASAGGADPAAVRQAMTGGFADSLILQIHGQRMRVKLYPPAATKCATE